jgi:hypothetical protein
MKSLKKFIFESTNEVITFIQKLNLNFTETGKMPNSTKEERAARAKVQEKIVIDAINEASETYSAVGIEEYCEKIGKKYSYELDSKLGDIIIYENGKESIYIDLKVGNSNKYIGTPTMLSLVNFGANNNDRDHFYFCTTLDGTDSEMVIARELYNYITTKNGSVMASKNRKTSSSEVSKLFDKVNLIKSSAAPDADLTKLYDEDYIPAKTIKDFNK